MAFHIVGKSFSESIYRALLSDHHHHHVGSSKHFHILLSSSLAFINSYALLMASPMQKPKATTFRLQQQTMCYDALAVMI